MLEQRIGKELSNGDPQPIADFLDGGYGGAVVPPADDIIEGGLGDPALDAESVEGDIPFFAKI